MFKKTSGDSNAEAIQLLREIRDLLSEGRKNAILGGLISSLDNGVVSQAGVALSELAQRLESEIAQKEE